MSRNNQKTRPSWSDSTESIESGEDKSLARNIRAKSERRDPITKLKMCRNINCKVTNPEFNKGRGRCKECHAQQKKDISEAKKNPKEAMLKKISELEAFLYDMNKQLQDLKLDLKNR